MASFSRTKTIYIDIETGRLIPKKLADRRDPATYRKEEVDIDIEVQTHTNFSAHSAGGAVRSSDAVS